jgi:hypothetical protein
MIHIARNGTQYGPYTEAQVREYIATGFLFATDAARRDDSAEWQPLSQLIAFVTPSRWEPPPDLPWWAALLLDIITGTIFFVVWDVVEAAWLHRVRPQSTALTYYAIAAVLFLLSAPGNYHSVMHGFFGTPLVETPFSGTLALAGLLVRLVARFSMRRSLCEHFNITEPIGLRLSWWMTLFFGGLYFQYHFNQINRRRIS